MAEWDAYVGEADRATIARARFARRVGYGQRPGLLVIDCQRYMVGERGVSDERYPSSCGAAGWAAVDQIVRLCRAARAGGVPIFFTRMALAPDGSDIGVYGRKRDLLQREDWCLESTPGSTLLPELEVEQGGTVMVKKKPSAFFGTPLAAYVIDRALDTLIVTGGATSNCVRASVFDASSYNLRTIVPREAVFDRIAVSHAISLFDMDRQFADVVATDAAVAYLQQCREGRHQS
jgi:nicotinamidase-related amidase